MQISKKVTQPATNETYINIQSVHDCNVAGSCGYCLNPKGSYTWGFECPRMSAEVYESLVNKGWRRCGSYYYKPNLDKSCCKSYTIRMNCNQYKIKRHQKRTVKTMLSLVSPKKAETKKSEKPTKMEIEKPLHKKPSILKQKPKPSKAQEQQNLKQIAILQKVLWSVTQSISNQRETFLGVIKEDQMLQLNLDVNGGIKIFVSKDSSKGDYYSNYAMLLYGKNKNIFKEKTTLQDFTKWVEMFLIQKLKQFCSDFNFHIEHSGYLIFKSIHALKLNEQSSEEFQVVGSEQKTSSDKSLSLTKNKKSSEQFEELKPQIKKQSLLTIQQEDPTWPDFVITYDKITFGKLVIEIVPVDQDNQSFRLYTKYNKNVHDKKQKDMSGYTNFLCVDGIFSENIQRNITEQQRISFLPSWDQKAEHHKPQYISGKVKKTKGCFHMKYYIQGFLIGVGVIDILHEGLSSVYFFYDHTYKQYRLGVFSSLVQIEYTKYLNKFFPQFKYYYMGFYIQNCQKMNYKADYEPCELLCPITYRYVAVDKALREKIEEIIKNKSSPRLSAAEITLLDEMKIPGDAGVFINNHLQLVMQRKKIVLSQQNKMFSLKILFLMKTMIPVFGSELFKLLKFQLWSS